jgi:hypothetical protein
MTTFNALALMTLLLASVTLAQNPPARVPSARLTRVPAIALQSLSDSNSPAVWEQVDGRQRLFMLTSEGGHTIRHAGADGSRLTSLGEVSFAEHPGHGVWFEAIVPDVDGTWYGFYHNELPAHVCNDPRAIPRIGAARSRDFGATWQDLGVVLASSPRSYDCASTNEYFVGGVGDFSVVLDDTQRYLYFFFSQYAADKTVQGVSVARLAWADRDAPTGKVSVWLRNQTWLPARGFRLAEGVGYLYPDGSPIYPVADAWHDGTTVDAFWGPSVHWNTHLQQYVMLLNRARDTAWTQEGVYVAFSPSLSEPANWSTPQRLIAGGRWYPQVLGTEVGTGTDRLAGERARFFMSGVSEFVIQFSR